VHPDERAGDVEAPAQRVVEAVDAAPWVDLLLQELFLDGVFLRAHARGCQGGRGVDAQ
jgi:hypothetical protein